ncbi:unnamed protein product [Rhizophagus irregularis]|nr:unnamed protein product [Rhizophagus irregularis]
MPPLPAILNDYIIKTKEKLNQSNLKTYCRCCIEALGEEVGRRNCFPNKTDRINNDLENLELLGKRKSIQDVPSYQSYGTASTTSSLPDSSGRKVVVRSSSYGPLDNFIVRSLSKKDKEKFYILLIRLTVACGWALQWVNKPEARELFEFLNPFLKLPDRRSLGGEILKDAVAEGDKVMEIALKEDQTGVTLTFDGWTNVRNEQLLGVVIMTSEGRPYVWKAVDISLERETHVEVMVKTEAMISDLKSKGVNVCAVVTDSASAYAAARRRLRISNRAIVFLPCFAHQINLCVGEIFKESTELKVALNNAIRLTTYFRNPNHKFFIAKLREQQKITYDGKIYALAASGETRWNSYYEVCSSLLRTQQALQILAINFKPPFSQVRRQAGETPTISREMFEIIDSESFWTNIHLIVEMLYPYCKILDILQKDKARLFQVTHCFAYLFQFWNDHANIQLAARIQVRLEKRWSDWEQPLLLLSCLLHPEYRIEQFKDNVNINYTTFGKWLKYYYWAWSGKESTCILREFDDFRLGKYPFDDDTYKQFNNDIWRYWCFARVSTNELGLVACTLFGICVNAASVERLWSCMGFLQTNRRNRLKSSKVLNMSKLRADITWKHRINSDSSILTPLNIITRNEEENNNEKEVEENLVIIEEEEGEEEEKEEEEEEEDLEKEFNNYLQGWSEMLEEETYEFGENENENDIMQITVDDILHPAIDPNAKWNLSSLFKELEFLF